MPAHVHLRRLVALAVALAAAAAALALTAATARAAPVELSAGHLDWGLKASWRDYINRVSVGPVQEGEQGTSLGGGAVAVGDTGARDGWVVRFPLEHGAYDPDTRETVLQLGGWVHFRQHCGGLFGGDVSAGCGLDMLLAEPRVEIREGRATVYARMRNRAQGASRPADYPEVELAALDVDALDPVLDGGTTAWDGIPATLLPEGAAIFTYGAGTALDPVSIAYDGPGGKPLAEQWSEPGEVVYADRELAAAPGGLRAALADDAHGELHALGSGADGAFHVLDGETLAPAATDDGVAEWGLASAALSAAGAARTTFAYGRASADGPWAVQALTWDGGALVREAVPGTAAAADAVPGGGVYDVGSGAYYAVVGDAAGASQHLWKVTGSAGAWAAEDLGEIRREGAPLAGLLGSLAVVPNGGAPTAPVLVGVGGGDALVLAPRDGFVAAARGVLNNSGPLDAITSGRWLVPAKAGTTDALALASHYANLFAVEDGRVGHHVISSTLAFPPRPRVFGAQDPLALPGAASARPVVSPVDGRLYIAESTTEVGRYDKAPGTLFASRIQREHAVDAAAAAPLAADSLVGVDFAGRLLVRAPGGATHAFAYRGVSPAVARQPDAATVTLTPPARSATAEYAVEPEGTPAPAIRWQSRLPGRSGWADLADGPDVEGAAEATLRVDVGADDAGRQFRAVLENAAGEVASAAAGLTVETPPSASVTPEDVTAAAGGSASFGVLAAGSPAPAVQWQMRVRGIWLDLPDADDGTYEIDAVTADMDGTLFRARLRNPVHTSYTAPARLTVSRSLAGPVTLAGGHVEWGFAERWRCYVVGAVAQGGIEVSGGVERVPGTTASGALCPGGAEGSEALRFPVRSGSYDPGSRRLELELGGSVRFWGHGHHVPGDPAPQLDTRFSRLRLVVEDGAGALVADVRGATLERPIPVERADVALVAVDAAGSAPAAGAEGLRWGGLQTALTADGAAVFGSYPAGEPFDALTLAPDYGAPPLDPGPGPDADPAQEPERAPQQGAARVPAEAAVAPAPTAGRARRAAAVLRLRRAVRVGWRGAARVAAVRCPRAGSRCAVRVRRRVRVRIGGRPHVVRVRAPRRLRAGTRGVVRVRLGRRAARRLVGRRTVVRVRVVARADGQRVVRTVRVVLRGRGA